MAESCADIYNRLVEARNAFHAISIGGVVRSVTDSDGSRIEYTQGNKSGLASYIALLQAQYDACIGGPAVLTKPVNYFF